MSKSEFIGVRLTPEQRRKLKRLADADAGGNLSQALRQLVDSQPMVPEREPEPAMG